MKYRRRLKYYLIKLCRLKDSPKAVAGGLAWGAFVHFYPTFGLGPLIAVFMAGLFRTNIVAATVGWAIIMPLFPLFFYFNLKIGDFLIGLPTSNIVMALHGLSHISLKDVFLVSKAFIIGSVINGILGVVFIWVAGFCLLKKYRKEILYYIHYNFKVNKKAF